MSSRHRLMRRPIIQGQCHVSDDPNLVLTTVLGSCVAACLRDPFARIGGMNHFLLPGNDDRTQSREAVRYGVHLMELLVNGLMSQGAQRERLEAKLFGGAKSVLKNSNIGAMNVSFAETFLRNEGICIIGGSLGGALGRRVEYWPVSGQARQIYLDEVQAVPMPVPVETSANEGDLELF